MTDDLPVPSAWRDAAEEVRAHLCVLRGRAPFMSPADALQLVQWFEQGIEVVSILAALERAAASRRKNGSKVPLALVHARRHLGRPVRGVFAREVPAHDPHVPFAAVVRSLKTAHPSPALDELERALRDIEPGSADEMVRAALHHVREFVDARWSELPPDDQDELSRQAAESLGDLVHVVDENTCTELVAEATRDRLRSGYPALTVASLWEAVANRGANGP